MASISEETGRHIALVDIRIPDNVRDLDPEHVKALAGSIGLQGMLVPIVVRKMATASSWSPASTASRPPGRSA